MNTRDWFDAAAQFAMRSPNKTHKTGCVIVAEPYGIIDSGWSHPSEWRYKGLRSMHAEIHALLRAKRIQNLAGTTAYVATVRTKSGTIANAQPCISCATALYSFGIRDVYFTMGDEDIGWIDLSCIEDLDLKEYKSVG